MTTALGEQAITDKLLATQIGEETFPVQTAYINNIVPLPVGNLQQVTDLGNVTTNDITAKALLLTGALTADPTISIQAKSNIVADTGDLVATAGNVTAGATMTAGTGITATAGGVTATAGGVTATVEDVTATAGDLVATAGGVLAAVGNSQLNRCEYTTDFGGTKASAPLSVAPQSITPLRVFTLPTGTFQLTVFLTNSQANAQEFAFEIHNLPANVLRDYMVVMNSQTYTNNGGFSLGFNGIVIGEAISDPTNNTKITCVFNVAQPYASQEIKCNVRFEYSPTPPP